MIDQIPFRLCYWMGIRLVHTRLFKIVSTLQLRSASVSNETASGIGTYNKEYGDHSIK